MKMATISCQLFKGCHTYGKTIEEALENIREVIELCIEEESLDESTKFVGYREIETEYELPLIKARELLKFPKWLGFKPVRMKGSV